MKYLRFLLILMFPALVYAQSLSVTNLRLNSGGNSSKTFTSGSFDTTINAQAFSVHRNAVGQVIPTGGSGTQIDWTTEEFDTNNVFNLTSETATLTEGYWSLCLAITFNSCTDTGVARAIIRKNSSSIAQLDFQCSTAKVQSSISCKTVFSDGDDQFDAYAFQDTGGDQTLSGSANSTWFTGHRIF